MISSAWPRRAAAGLSLAAVVWRVGTGPFLDGVHDVNLQALAAAAGIGAVITISCAWRWSMVARGHGLRLSLSAAVAGCYRSTFLNLALPGGVVGDVHRGVRHGRDVGDTGRALRAVAWERALGQLVQGALTVSVLLVMPSPVHGAMPLVAAALAATVAVLALATRAGRPRLRARLARALGWDLGGPRQAARTLAAVALASALVVLGSAVMFLVAARTAGVAAPLPRMVPLALLALLAMVLPGVAGWGPREGGAAWVFGAAGLGAGAGVATAVVFGVMALAASLPGALLLVGTSTGDAGWWRRAGSASGRVALPRRGGRAADA